MEKTPRQSSLKHNDLARLIHTGIHNPTRSTEVNSQFEKDANAEKTSILFLQIQQFGDTN